MSDERLIATGEVTKIYNKRAVYHPPPPLLRKESYAVIIDSNGQVVNNDEDSCAAHECSEKCVTSLLHDAARTGDVEEMELLLESGADPNKRDCMGRTPLHCAVTMG